MRDIKGFGKTILADVDNGQKRQRKIICQENLDLFNVNETDFVLRIFARDKTWVHYYIYDIKQQLHCWHNGSPPTKKA